MSKFFVIDRLERPIDKIKGRTNMIALTVQQRDFGLFYRVF